MSATVTPSQAPVPVPAPTPAAEAPTIPAGPTDDEVMAKDQTDMAAEIARLTAKVSPDDAPPPTEPAPVAAATEEPAKAEAAQGATALEKAERLAARHKARAEESRRNRASQESAAQAARERDEALNIARQQREYIESLQDPKRAMELLRQRGMTPEALAQHALEDRSPEGQLATMKREFDALRSQLARQQQLTVEEQQAAAQQRETREAHARYLQQASDEEKYPFTAQRAQLAPAGLIAETIQLARDLKRATGFSYSNSEILEHLEEQSAKAYEAAQKKKGAAAKETTSPDTAKQATKPAAKPASQTLSNASAAQKTELPKTLDDLSDEESVALMAKAIQDMHAKIASEG